MMSEWWQQVDGPTESQQQAAWEWFGKHRDHVLRMVRRHASERSGQIGLAYFPTDREDCHRPELWVAAHWTWLLRARGVEAGESGSE